MHCACYRFLNFYICLYLYHSNVFPKLIAHKKIWALGDFSTTEYEAVVNEASHRRNNSLKRILSRQFHTKINSKPHPFRIYNGKRCCTDSF